MPEFGGEFRLVVDRERGRMDSLTVQAEVTPEVYRETQEDSAALSLVNKRFAGELSRALGVGLTVELEPTGKFERAQFKARRVIDKRRY